MSWRLKNPLWLHFPVLASLAACIAVPPLTRPWPPRPRGYTWEDWATPVALVTLLLVFAFVESELWTQAENGKKRFNRYLLWPAGIGGWVAGIQIGIYWGRLQGLTADSMAYAAGGAAFCLAGALVLEWLRRPSALASAPPASTAISDVPSAGSRWTYFTIERSRWINRALISLLSVGPLFLMFAMDGRFRHIHWPDLVIFVTMLLPLLVVSLVGTLLIQVNSERLVLRSGLGFPLLRLSLADISGIAVESLHPLADFGGSGVRQRRGVRAYLFGGSRGVSLEMRDGKIYLIACREPERLATVIRASAPKLKSSNAP